MIFQLTTSQGGRRKDGDRDDSHKSISTHDLARRSTEIVIFSIKAHFISTHDLARRSTKPPLFFILNPSLFQLTTSQGGRLFLSITCVYKLYFNSRPRKEVDLQNLTIVIGRTVFQLTTSQGGRHRTFFMLLSSVVFQLTTSQGGRQNTTRYWSQHRSISTHDLARRSTKITSFF